MTTHSVSNVGTSSLLEPPSEQHAEPPFRARPFDQLATETIEEIFILTCHWTTIPHYRQPAVKSDTDSFLLSLVCRRWHKITMTSHSLWSTVRILPSRLNDAQWSQWGFLRLRSHLTRSGTRPLQIWVKKYDSKNKDNNNTVISGVLEIIASQSERWRSVQFDFTFEPRLINILDKHMGPLPLLESLDFRPSYTNHFATSRALTEGAFLRASSLKCIRLQHTNIFTSMLRNIPWTQLSEVTFHDVGFILDEDLRKCLEDLSGSLTALSVKDSACRWLPEPGERPIVLSRLRRLHLEGLSWTALLSVLICPSLEWLHVEDGDRVALASFLVNSSCTLTHIHFHDLRVRSQKRGDKEYVKILQAPAFSALKSISIRELTDPVLHLLIFDSHQWLPSLETLRIRLEFARKEDSTQYLISRIEGLQKIVESRTQAMSPNNQLSTSSDDLQSTFNPRNVRVPLKHCFFAFELEADKEKVDDYWDITVLDALESFCLSRSMLGQLEISYTFHVFDFFSHAIPNVNSLIE